MARRLKDYMRGLSSGRGVLPRLSQDEHVLSALEAWKHSRQGSLELVDSEGFPVGEVAGDDLLQAMSDVFAPLPDSCLIEVRCARSDYSASRIARAVEDADVSLMGLWCQKQRHDDDAVVAILMVDAREPLAVMRSLRRYGYEPAVVGNYSDYEMEAARQNLEALRMFLEI